jgi:hypothetical protein
MIDRKGRGVGGPHLRKYNKLTNTIGNILLFGNIPNVITLKKKKGEREPKNRTYKHLLPKDMHKTSGINYFSLHFNRFISLGINFQTVLYSHSHNFHLFCLNLQL